MAGRAGRAAAAAAGGPARARFGAWPSPLTSEAVTRDAVGLQGVQFGARGQGAYWLEARPWEGGRSVIVRGDTGEDLTPPGMNVRTRVHEYGGGAWAVLPSLGLAVFSDFASQRLFAQRLDGSATPQPLTPDVEGAKLRFADCCLDERRGRLICVMEDHRGGGKEPVNSLAAVPLPDGDALATWEPHEPEVIVSGADFYSSPALDPSGDQLAYVSWDHPAMPWDITALAVAQVGSDGSLSEGRVVSGGTGAEEAPQQPRWAPDGTLYFITDRDSGWWNLWAAEGLGTREGHSLRSVCPMEGAEFGGPPWTFGQRSFDFLPKGALGSDRAGNILCSYSSVESAGKVLAVLDPVTGQIEMLDTADFTTFGSLAVGEGGTVALVGGSAREPPQVATRGDLGATGRWDVLKRSREVTVDAEYLSEPEVIEYPSGPGGRRSYMYYYPPTNKDVGMGLPGEKPPLLVKSHGGPTSAASPGYNLVVQYFTSRGFAVADVNYGGSTGYGRSYRERLKGSWGIVDVEDCAAAAEHLAREGLVDPERMAIDGGSAGGYTTLACLAFTDVFSAGCSLYGVASLEALAGDTHKFESRYLDYLVGPYPEMQDVYKARAPIENLDGINAPLCLFQGLEDKIVPPNQAQMMFDACERKGLPACLEMFEGEQHGFRQDPNIRRVLDGEYSFYAQIFGFEPAGLPEDFEPVKISRRAAPPPATP